MGSFVIETTRKTYL